MSRAKSHHVVPRRYLARFAKDGLVEVVRFGADAGPESIRRAARVSEFYTTRGAAGEPVDLVERWLNDVEKMLYPGFQAIDGGQWPLKPEDRERVALWIAVQYLRTPIVRELGTKLGGLVVEQELSDAARADFVQRQLRDHPDADEQVVREIAETSLDQAKRHLLAKAASAEWHADGIERYARPLAEGLLQRQWTIIRFRRSALVTSDDPVGLQCLASEPAGLSNAAVVTFPVDRRTGLVMLHEEGADKLGRPSASVARRLNQLTINRARRSVFYHPDDQPLAGLSIPTGPRRVAIKPEVKVCKTK